MIEFVLFILAAVSGQADAVQQTQISSPVMESAIEAIAIDRDNEGNLCEGQTFASAEEALQSGCCSHHGGVCGCRNGRKVCCDRTLSPSCRC
ncbi:hypothetical protein DFR46_2963 [Parasphingopyxis lamellibrachiae]|uniref:Uncharacterized protein n=1 Tax=Parasphingopyxis lamellibrachiae TaxID=680125 RepID=A0A3D9F7D1_9SPHN|nr:hypothetical protein DFR46_2963 [Parasphingopyxis lamellibrachiae]